MSALDRQPEELRRRIAAYPGSLTFHDLIRRNRRESAVLMAFMVLLAVLVGGVIASAIVVYSGAADFRTLVPSIALGCGVGLIAALIGATWSWFGGAGAMLTMVGAREVTREQDAQLLNVVEELALAAGLPMPRVYLIPETALNAFATGRDPQHGVVAITTGLRERLTRDELQGVLAHEMAHIRHLDIRFAMLMATMAGLVVFACDAFLRIAFRSGGRGHRRGGRDGGGGAAVIVLIVIALVLAIIAPLVARIIQMSYSRQREYLADAGAVELTRNPEGLASALQKLAGDDEPLVDTANRGMAHMFIVNPLRTMRQSHQQRSSVFSSHPPIQERIARLLALAR